MERRPQRSVYRPFRFSLSPPRSTKGLFTGYGRARPKPIVPSNTMPVQRQRSSQTQPTSSQSPKPLLHHTSYSNAVKNTPPQVPRWPHLLQTQPPPLPFVTPQLPQRIPPTPLQNSRDIMNQMPQIKHSCFLCKPCRTRYSQLRHQLYRINTPKHRIKRFHRPLKWKPQVKKLAPPTN